MTMRVGHTPRSRGGRCLQRWMVALVVCVSASVQGEWSEWGGWVCLGDGDSANRTRTQVVCEAGSNCTTLVETQTTAPVVVMWLEWSEWTPSCNNATDFQQFRSRTCTLPPPEVPVCISQCGSQNRTVTASRTVPRTPCCEDLAWGEWSEWCPSCADLLCDQLGTSEWCVWLTREPLPAPGAGTEVVSRTRSRERGECTEERCPVCEGEAQNRTVSLQAWASWGAWSSEEGSCDQEQRIRQRACLQLVEGVGSYCVQCDGVGEVESVTEVINKTTSDCSGESDGGSRNQDLVISAMVAMLVVIVLCVMLGAIFGYLCWREFRWKESYAPHASSHPSLSTPHQPRLVFSRAAGRDAAPMTGQNGGIPRHHLLNRDHSRRLETERLKRRDAVHGEAEGLSDCLEGSGVHSSKENLLEEPSTARRDPAVSKASRKPSQRVLFRGSRRGSSQEELLGSEEEEEGVVEMQDEGSEEEDNSLSWL